MDKRMNEHYKIVVVCLFCFVFSDCSPTYFLHSFHQCFSQTFEICILTLGCLIWMGCLILGGSSLTSIPKVWQKTARGSTFQTISVSFIISRASLPSLLGRSQKSKIFSMVLSSILHRPLCGAGWGWVEDALGQHHLQPTLRWMDIQFPHCDDVK